MLSVQVWDKTNVGPVDKAIRSAGLGLNPIVDGQTLRLTKFVAYHTAHDVPLHELSDRCARTLARAVEDGTVDPVALQALQSRLFAISADVERDPAWRSAPRQRYDRRH